MIWPKMETDLWIQFVMQLFGAGHALGPPLFEGQEARLIMPMAMFALKSHYDFDPQRIWLGRVRRIWGSNLE